MTQAVEAPETHCRGWNKEERRGARSVLRVREARGRAQPSSPVISGSILPFTPSSEDQLATDYEIRGMPRNLEGAQVWKRDKYHPEVGCGTARRVRDDETDG